MFTYYVHHLRIYTNADRHLRYKSIVFEILSVVVLVDDRLKKMVCYFTQVRYQSRKKLAEQRPRVRGQFVRKTAAATDDNDIKTPRDDS